MIGASLAAGFHASEYKNWKGHPKSDALSFDKALATLLPEHDEIPLQGSRFFFMAVETVGKTQIDRALAHESDIIYAVDYLFWHLYGDLPDKSDGARMKLFEKGLVQLDRLHCPLVVGDLLDAKAAVGRILSRAQMPTDEELEQANQRLREWAQEKKQVKILPLSHFLAQASKNQELKVGPQVIKAGETRALLQDDLLHPTHAGVIALARAAIACLRESE